jgi:cell division transport system permease protein
MKFKPGTVLTLVSLTITLFLIGFYLMVLVHLSKLEDIVNEKTPFVIELVDSLPQPELFLLQQDLKARPYILESSLEYIAKDEALQLLEEGFGQTVLSDSSSNPLKDVLRFKLKTDFIKSGRVEGLMTELNALASVENSYFEAQQVKQLKHNLKKLNQILLLIGLLFVLISVLLIYNNLKLVLRNDRFMLKTMELVGASPGFIKLPYVKKSLQIGVLAALINLVLFAAVFLYLNGKFELFNHFFDLSYTIMVMVLIFFIGIFFPLVFSNILVNRYIRMSDEKRHH